MEFGKKLRTLRKEKIISQTELAQQIHVSRRTVNNWEHEGRHPKDRRTYESLARVLECPVEYLLSDKPGLVADIYEQFGMNREYVSRQLLLDIKSYFMSSSVSAEKKDTLMFAIHESYIEARKECSDSWQKRKLKYLNFC